MSHSEHKSRKMNPGVPVKDPEAFYEALEAMKAPIPPSRIVRDDDYEAMCFAAANRAIRNSHMHLK